MRIRIFNYITFLSYTFLVNALKIQHIKTPCWTFSCYDQYDQHYNSILNEINKNPNYLHHNTILYYSSLFTTIVYQ
jgi:hypothetical protein